MGTFHVIVGDAEISLGNLDASIDEYRKAIDLGLQAFFRLLELGRRYAQAGRMGEAKAALAEACRHDPKLTVKWMMAHTPNLPAVFDGLRRIGMLEGKAKTN
jgi:tetratricopeptide (TPR) repeat protein